MPYMVKLDPMGGHKKYKTKNYKTKGCYMFRNKSLALGGVMLLIAGPAEAKTFPFSFAKSHSHFKTWEFSADPLEEGEAMFANALTRATPALPAVSPAISTAQSASATAIARGAASLGSFWQDLEGSEHLFTNLWDRSVRPAFYAAGIRSKLFESTPADSFPAAIAAPAIELPVAESPALPPAGTKAVEAESVMQVVIGVVTDTVADMFDTLAEAISDGIDTVTDTVDSLADSFMESIDEAFTPAPSDLIETPEEPETVSPPAVVAGTPGVPVAAAGNNAALTPDIVDDESLGAAQVFRVSNITELRAALEAALTIVGGAEIRVNPGNYGGLVWTKKKYTLGRVYLIAATSERPVFTGMNLGSSEGMAIVGMQFSSDNRAIVSMNSSRDIIFAGNLLTGANRNLDAWDDNNTGLHLRWAERVTVTNNVFEDLRGGIYLQQANKITLEYNTLHHIREGLNIAATNDLDITRNYFRDFQPNVPRGEHPDTIQFWTSGEEDGSSNVRLIENVMLHGGCAAVQGIFIRSETEGRAVPQIRHKDFTIRGNVYYGASKNGLSVSSVDRATVENNVIIASPYSETGVSRAEAQARDPRCSGALRPAILSRFDTTTHVFRRNIVAQMDKTDGVSTDNIEVGTTVGDPYTSVFMAQPTGETPPLAAFRTRNPSAARTREIGLLSTYDYGATLSPKAALRRGLSIHKK